MDINKIIIDENSTIRTAIKQLDLNAKKILTVVEKGKLKAVITDGDIRRWILKGGDLNVPISSIMNTHPISLEYSNRAEAKILMKKHFIEAVPIVDEDNNLVSIIFWNDVEEGKLNYFEKLDNSVVIMAGGKGTRLYPYTKILPKPLIPIGDITIIERIIKKFTDYGCNKFYLTLNHKKKMIKAYFNEIERDYTVYYIEEEKPLGTGGSLHLLKNIINDTFFVSNCDILIDANYSHILKFHNRKNNKITIVTSLKHFVIPYGVIELNHDGQIEKIIEKPQFDYLINTGMYVLEPDVLNDIPEGKVYNLTDLYEDYMKKGEKVGVYPISENSWMDMGQIDEMQKMIESLEGK
ncbi:MAG: nucleotidyltransferase family protein [Clostridiaceae bacterium]